jgi:hypothetical protein
MKIKILKATPCGGKVRKAGATVDASTSEGRLLVNLGKAEEVGKKNPSNKAPANKALSTEDLETR